MTAADEAFLASAFRAVAEQAARQGTRLLISNEGISGNLWGDPTGLRNAGRLSQVLPDARILFVVRNQPEMIASIYGQYVNEGGHGTFAEFLAGDIEGPSFDFTSLEYDRLAAGYIDLFGRDNVFVALYEDLRRDPDAFVDAIAAFFGTSRPPRIEHTRVNVSLSAGPILALRLWNRAFRVSTFNPTPAVKALRGGRTVRNVLQEVVDPILRPVTPSLREQKRQALEAWGIEKYAASNTRLSKLCGRSLRELRYP
ncbi:MAG: sulfotransferase [Gaiellaceae bacterium]